MTNKRRSASNKEKKERKERNNKKKKKRNRKQSRSKNAPPEHLFSHSRDKGRTPLAWQRELYDPEW